MKSITKAGEHGDIFSQPEPYVVDGFYYVEFIVEDYTVSRSGNCPV